MTPGERSNHYNSVVFATATAADSHDSWSPDPSQCLITSPVVVAAIAAHDATSTTSPTTDRNERSRSINSNHGNNAMTERKTSIQMALTNQETNTTLSQRASPADAHPSEENETAKLPLPHGSATQMAATLIASLANDTLRLEAEKSGRFESKVDCDLVDTATGPVQSKSTSPTVTGAASLLTDSSEHLATSASQDDTCPHVEAKELAPDSRNESLNSHGDNHRHCKSFSSERPSALTSIAEDGPCEETITPPSKGNSGSKQRKVSERTIRFRKKNAAVLTDKSRSQQRTNNHIAVVNSPPGLLTPASTRSKRKQPSHNSTEILADSESRLIQKRGKKSPAGKRVDFMPALRILTTKVELDSNHRKVSCLLFSTMPFKFCNANICFLITRLASKMVEGLGGILVNDINDAHTASHVIASNGKLSLKRTPKLMIALNKTANIVTLNWLTESAKSGKALPCSNYFILDDKEAESRYGFSMKKTLDRVRQNIKHGTPVLGGFAVFVCKGVAGNKSPPENELKLIIEAAGGEWVSSLSALLNARNDNSRRGFLIITSNDPEDRTKQLKIRAVASALKHGAVAKSTSWLFQIMMTQQLDI